MKNQLPPLYRIAYVISIIAALIVTIGWGMLIFTRSSVAHGIMIGDELIGGLSREELVIVLTEKINTYNKTPMRLILNEFAIQTTPKDLGISFDIEKNADALLAIGRKGQLSNRAITAFMLTFRQSRAPLLVEINQETLSTILQSHFPEYEKPASNASLTIKDNKLIVSESHDGQIINRPLLLPLLQTSATLLESRDIPLQVIDDNPTIRTEAVLLAQDQALAILKRTPITLTVAKTTDPLKTVLTYSDIIDALIFTPIKKTGELNLKIDPATIRDQLLGSIAPALNRAPTNLRLSATSDDDIIIERPSNDGIAIIISKENINIITNGILKGNSPINLIASLIPANLNENRLKELGITHRLASETTDFSGSPASRKHNIAVAAALYDGIILKPNEEFSFNNLLGEVEAREGYLPELVIKNNKTIPEYGGGICQVSTTAFRTAVFAGLEITQRYPHSYVVSYYGEPGFDATIYPPNPDLRFRNDSPNHLLIQTKVEKNLITFEFYGTNDGRKITIIGPTILESNEDGSMRTVIRQVVKRDGETVRDDSFWSSYKSAELYPIIRNPLE